MTQFVFNPTVTAEIFGGTRHEFHFENNYGASVVCHKGSYGGADGLWELAVIDLETDQITYDTPITNDEVGWLTPEEVNSYLDRIKLLKPKNYNPTLIVVPFSGFYENGFVPNLINHEDYPKWTLNYVKRYTQTLSKILRDELEIDIILEFESLEQPKFYNFETDIIFAEISHAAINQLYGATPKVFLTKWANKRHTSREGFVSHYDPDWQSWGDLIHWDHNQLQTLLLAAMDCHDIPTNLFDLEFLVYETGNLDEVAYEFEVEDEVSLGI